MGSNENGMISKKNSRVIGLLAGSTRFIVSKIILAMNIAEILLTQR